MAGAAGLLLTLAVVLPPEIHPAGRIAVQVVAALALLLLAARGGCALPGSTLPLLPLAIAPLLAAACRSRAVDEAAAAATLLAAGLLGRRVAAGARSRRILVALLVVLATGAAVRAAIQHHVTYPRQAAELRAIGPEDVTGLRGRLERGRPSGPFSLPAALGGFLGLSLPAALVAAARSRRPGVRLAAGAAALLQGYALVLSRSIGALSAAAAGVALVLPLLAPRRPGRGLAGVALLALAGALLFARSRPEIGGPAGSRPSALRAGNWSAAVRMILDHPLAGTGPGSFGTVYTRYRRPGMNETRYAHNSYLQAAAGWGAWVALPLGLLLGCVATAARRAWLERDAERLPALAAGSGFLLHNLVDFTAYLPGVAIPAALIIGLGLGPGGEAAAPAGTGARRRRLAGAAAALMAVCLSAHGVAAGRTAMLLDAALSAAAGGDLDRAAALARRAIASRPGDPEPHAFLAQLVLNERLHDPRLRAEGVAAAERALALDPEAAILHYTRALYHQAAGETAAAYRERYAAHRLYPLKPIYAPESAAREDRP
jgi:hypothetical protein